MSKIYGVDPEKGVSPEEVRNAIVECFYKAHCLDTGIGEEKSKARV